MKPKHIGIFLIVLASLGAGLFIAKSNSQSPIPTTPKVAMPPKKVSKIAEVDTTIWFVREPMEIKVGF